MRKITAVLALGVAVTALLASGCSRDDSPRERASTKVRIGWQTAWATQGQVVQALRMTGILEANGLRGEFTGFTAGPPAMEAALAGALDVVAGGSQPILQLLSRSDDWVIVGRHANVRLGILVPLPSVIENFAGLRGKKVGLPVGSTVERFVLLRAKAEGIPFNEIELINIGIDELGEFVRRGESWGDVAAVGAWEPTVSLIEQQGLGRVIAEENEITLTVMSKGFIDKQPEAAVAFMRALLEAWHYYATHRSELNKSYIKESALVIDEGLLEKIAANEPNARVARLEDVDISVGKALQVRLQQSADFLFERKILARPVRIVAALKEELLAQAGK